MNIIFKNILLENFMSFEYAEVDLTRTGYTYVKGINENPTDNALSNGSGKSSIFSALCWCLTGQSLNGSKTVENNQNTNTCKVTLTFSVDSDDYTVERYKRPSNLKVYINGKDMSGKGIRDTEKLLSEYLPDINSSLINSVIVLGQGMPGRFTNNTPAGRKEVLETLSKSDFMIEDLKTRLADRKTVLKNEIESWTADYNVCQQNIVEAQTRLEIATKDLNELQAIDVISELHSIEYSIDTLSNDLERDRATFDALEDRKNMTLTKLGTLVYDESALNLYDLSDLLNSRMELNTIIASKESEIKRLDSVVDICPTCGQKLINVTKIDTTNMKLEVENLKVNLQALNDEISIKESENDAQRKTCRDLYEQERAIVKKELDQITQEEVSLNEQINNYITELNSLNFRNDVLKRTQEKIDTVKSNITQYRWDIDRFTDESNDIDYKIKLNEDRLDVNSKMITAANRDFRTYLLTNVVQYIDIKAKEYCKIVFNNEKLNVVIEGNNIGIYYDDKEYESLSGGEKQKIDIILQFALRSMLCTYLSFSSNILVLDEIFDALDVTGSQKILDLITYLNDVESMYIISHHSDFQIPFDNEIIVKKGVDKISRLL